MNSAAPHYLTLAQLSSLIRTRVLSPVEVLESQLTRIRELDTNLNAYAMVLEEAALAQARTAEAEVMAGRWRGPLHGVPIAVKDVFFTKGMRTQGGLQAFAQHTPTFDAAALNRLYEGGAVLLGKLHTTEGAMDGYHRDFPIPRNPWGALRWPGVSSSGSGVSVAAGTCFGSLATDSGGSVRIPAAANGIVGMKPTFGTISNRGVMPLTVSFDHVGTLTRSVDDAAILFGLLTGPNEQVTPDFTQGLKGLRIGFDETAIVDSVESCQSEALHEALLVFERCGAQILDMRLPNSKDAIEIWYEIAAAEASRFHRETFPSRSAEYGQGLRSFLQKGYSVSEAAYEDAQLRRTDWVRAVAICFQEFDALLSPSLPGEAFLYDPEDAYRGPALEEGHSDGVPLPYLEALNRFMLPSNLTGYPALSLPCGVSPSGMPLGMQLTAKKHSERLLFQCGSCFESQTDMHLLHPLI